MRRIKVAITVLAMILLSGFAAGQLSAKERTSFDARNELFEARKNVSYIEKRDNLDTEAMRKVKALEKEIEELKAKEKAEREAFNAKVEAQKLRTAEYRAQNAYKNAWLHTLAAKKYFDLTIGEGKWASNIDYNKITEEEAKKGY